jgi:hypothetical protein
LKFLTNIFPVLVQYAGLAIAVWETLIDQVDRPSLLLLAAGMMGLDRVITSARKKNGSEENGNTG